jgi:hypothetical protein
MLTKWINMSDQSSLVPRVRPSEKLGQIISLVVSLTQNMVAAKIPNLQWYKGRALPKTARPRSPVPPDTAKTRAIFIFKSWRFDVPCSAHTGDARCCPALQTDPVGSVPCSLCGTSRLDLFPNYPTPARTGFFLYIARANPRRSLCLMLRSRRRGAAR